MKNLPKTEVTRKVTIEEFLSAIDFLQKNPYIAEYRKWYRQPLVLANNVGGTISYRVAIVLLDLIEQKTNAKIKPPDKFVKP